MGMGTLPYLVFYNFKYWGSSTPYFGKFIRAKRTSILVKDRNVYFGKDGKSPFILILGTPYLLIIRKMHLMNL